MVFFQSCNWEDRKDEKCRTENYRVIFQRHTDNLARTFLWAARHVWQWHSWKTWELFDICIKVIGGQCWIKNNGVLLMFACKVSETVLQENSEYSPKADSSVYLHQHTVSNQILYGIYLVEIVLKLLNNLMLTRHMWHFFINFFSEYQISVQRCLKLCERTRKVTYASKHLIILNIIWSWLVHTCN